MTARAKCLIGLNGSYYPYKPTKLEVHRHGTRAVDTAKVEFSGRPGVSNGDDLYVIMDNFDLNHLAGLWNFQRHGRDESGQFNHFVKNSDSSEIHLDQGLFRVDSTYGTSRMRGRTNLYVLPSTSQATHHYRPQRNIALHDEFDFYVWCAAIFRPGSAYSYHTLFYLSPLSPTTSDLRVTLHTDWTYRRAWLGIRKSGGTVRLSQTEFNINQMFAPMLLRVAGKKISGVATYRITLYHNGTRISEIDASLNALNPRVAGTTPHFYSDVGLQVYHARFYTEHLPNHDQLRMVRTIPPVLSMKFGGKVWKSEDKVALTKVQAQGFGQDILFSVVQFPDTLTGTAYARATFNGTNGRYNSGLKVSVILNDILSRLNFSMIDSTNNDYTMVGETNIRHPTITTTGALTAMSSTQLVSDANRIVHFEDESGIFTTHVALESESCHVSTVDSDSTNVVNDISFINAGRNRILLAQDSQSIDRFGTKSRKLEYEGFLADDDNSVLLQRLLESWATPRPRYEVVHNSHVHHLRENYLIEVIDSNHGISGQYKIFSMSWYYPNIRTVINCGAHRLDAFDISQRSKIDLSELKYTTVNSTYPIWIEAAIPVPYIRGRSSAAST